MKKGIISLAIVLAMVVSMFVPAFAEEAAVEPIIKDLTVESNAIVSGLQTTNWNGIPGATDPIVALGYDAEEGASKIEVLLDCTGATGFSSSPIFTGLDATTHAVIGVYYRAETVPATLADGTTPNAFVLGGLKSDYTGYGTYATVAEGDEYTWAYWNTADGDGSFGVAAMGLYNMAAGTEVYIKAVVAFPDQAAADAFDFDEYLAEKEAMKEQLKAEAALDAFVADFAGISNNRYTNGVVMNDCGNQANWMGLDCGESYWNREGYWHVEITETKDVGGFDVTAMMTEIAGIAPKDGGYTKVVVVYRSNAGFTVYEGGLASNLGSLANTNEEWKVGVLNVPNGDAIQATASKTPFNYDKMILVADSGAVGTYVDVAGVMFVTDAAYTEVMDLEFFYDYVANNQYVYDNNVYFDYNGENANVWFNNYNMWAPYGDDVSLLFNYNFLELGMFRCTTHGLDCLMNDDFFDKTWGELSTEPVIKCQVSQNSKYAKVEASYDGEGGIDFKVTPIDNFITKDIDIEVQLYVIRNVANQAHKSNTVKFTLTLTNRYINDKDIAAIAGEDCPLFIDETAYVVKGYQFAEAGDKSVSIAWWNGTDDSDFVIDFASVAGQEGINFRWWYIGEAPEAVKDLSTTAKWAGLTFGSDEAIVNGATVKVFNSFGEEFKYAYVLDGEGNLTYIGEYAKDAEYIEFAVEAGDALGTMLVSNEKFEPVADPEPEQPSEPSEPSEDEDDKEAPGTGAGANMMSLAVVAVVALAGAAVVASKK